MKNNTKILLGVISLCFCGSCIFFLISFVNSLNPFNPYENPSKELKGYTTSKIFFDSSLPDIKNKKLVIRDVEQVEVPEISILLDALISLKDKGIEIASENSITLADINIDESKLDYYVNSDDKRKNRLTIPSNYLKYFRNTEEITTLLNQSRAEFLEYLLKRGVSRSIIDEIDMNVLPEDPDRIKYFVNARVTDISSTTSPNIDGKKDYTKTEMSIYDKDIYIRADYVIKSGILGEAPSGADFDKFYITARNMGLRLLMYHEMTHVLQKAYININLPANSVNDVVGWMDAKKTLMGASSDLFWNWNKFEPFESINNKEVSDESQADGISFDALTNVYDLDEDKQTELWKHWFGRLESMKEKLNQIKKLTETNFTNISQPDWGDLLSVVFRTSNLENSGKLATIVQRLNSLPSYVGYLNPMLPSDSDIFWYALKD